MQNQEKIKAEIADIINGLNIDENGMSYTFYPLEVIESIMAAIAPHLEAVAGLKPIKLEKNHLPDDVKLLFHKGVGLYQFIQNYELGVLTKDEFVSDMRKVESKFKQDTLNPPKIKRGAQPVE